MGVKKQIIVRFSVFAFLLLVVIPLWFSTFLDVHYVWGIRASFFFLKIFKLAVLSCLILLFIIWENLKKHENWSFNWKHAVLFGFAAFLLLYGSFSTQSSMATLASEGVKIRGEEINFDGGRLLAFNILADTQGAFYDANAESSDVLFKKVLYLDDASNSKRLLWHGAWYDENENGALDSKIFVSVNNNDFDVSGMFSKSDSHEGNWFFVEIPLEYLVQGENEIVFFKNNSSDSFAITSQDVYQEGQSFSSKNGGASWNEHWRTLVVYFEQPHSFFFSLLFKFGFVFKILAAILLFMAIFGIEVSKSIVKKSWKELLFATVFAYWVYWFSEFIKTKWYVFAGAVSSSIYFLFRITGFDPVRRVNAEGIPIVGVSGFAAGVYDVCSGVESIAFFTLAYFMLIVFHWRKVSFWKSLLMYLPGVAGVFALNIIRVYVLILIGAKWSADFALNAFHTNAGMVFSVIYFIIFLPFALRIIEIKKPKNK